MFNRLLGADFSPLSLVYFLFFLLDANRSVTVSTHAFTWTRRQSKGKTNKEGRLELVRCMSSAGFGGQDRGVVLTRRVAFRGGTRIQRWCMVMGTLTVSIVVKS